MEVYTIRVSLSRTAVWLHQCTDLLKKAETVKYESSVTTNVDYKQWKSLLQIVDDTSIGIFGFPSPPVVNSVLADSPDNLICTDGVDGWSLS